MRHKKNTREKEKYNYKIIGVAVVTLALLGTLLPGWLLRWQSEGQVSNVNAVPVEYYSPANLAVARNASAKLEMYQKLQLITGKWESNKKETASYERTLEDYEVVALAKEKLEAMYRKGLYPYNLQSEYGNWYTWEAKFYKAVDATFDTYAAYYWEIVFEKYDGSQWHRIYMLEDGTIFLAETRADKLDVDAITKVSEAEVKSLFEPESTKKGVSSNLSQSVSEYLSFADKETGEIEMADMEWMASVQLRIDEQVYLLVQANSKNCYIFSLQPSEE